MSTAAFPPQPHAASTTPAALQQFLDSYEREHATTMKVLRAFPEDQLELRPHPRSNSARDLAWIFVLERMLGQRIVIENVFASDNPPRGMPKPPESMATILSEVERTHREFGDAVRSLTERELGETVRFFVAPKTMGDIPRMDFLWFLLHDEIHHRGQFSVYLRMAGGKVPSIYGPSADEPWM